MKRVLVGCETSGRVREAFRKRGHEAWSCDLLPADDKSPWHFQCDVRHVLYVMRGYFDLFIVHPECTYMCVSGLHWNKRIPGRAEKTEASLAFVQEMMDTDIPQIVLENPRGCISTRIRKPEQEIQPYQFGDDASKLTCLWLKGVEPLVIDPAKFVKPRLVCKRCKGVCGYDAAFSVGCTHCGAEPSALLPRWANQTDSGQNKLGPSVDRWKLRSETYQGIADAFAENWG